MPSPMNLSKAADQCVMCGMCLPHCPTYQVSLHEAESPRGRISLVKALAEGKLDPSASLATHLQSCTGCMQCQQICPANVPYQYIIDQGRQLYRRKLTPLRRWSQLLYISVLTHTLGHRLISLTKFFIKLLPINNQSTRILRHLSSEVKTIGIKHAPETVTIFPGCTGPLLDQPTMNSIVRILNALNVKARLPDKILCCGALAQHSGHQLIAEKRLGEINKFLSEPDSAEFISFATGCGRHLNENISKSQTAHKDIIDWLSSHEAFTTTVFKPFKQRVLVHMPCTMQNSTRVHVMKLLSAIPEIQLLTFEDNLSCCGAGGMQIMSPEQSNRALLEAKIDRVRMLQPDLIVSANIGCALNLKLGLDSANLDIAVVHPVTLLARQLLHSSTA